MKKIHYGGKEYKYNLEYRKRKTFALAITPDLTISLRAPENTRLDEIERFLKKKIFWIDKQLSFFAQFKQKTHKKEYISGENFLYLGRRHMLVVKGGEQEKVSLGRGKINIITNKAVDTLHVQKLIDKWFRARAEKIFSERFAEVFDKFGYSKKPELRLRKMKRRWGSYHSNGVVVLNPILVHASKKQIDYVITHELCHVKHQNHSKDFYALLEQKFPRWKTQKEELERLIFNEF